MSCRCGLEHDKHVRWQVAEAQLVDAHGHVLSAAACAPGGCLPGELGAGHHERHILVDK